MMSAPRRSFPRDFAAPVMRPCLCLGVLLVLAACSKAPAPPPPKGPATVGVVVVQVQPVTMVTELPGRTTPFQIAEIRPQVGGLLEKRLFTEGADVRAGEALYQIVPASFQASLDAAKAVLGKAEASLGQARLKADRARELVAIKAVSQQDFEDAQALVKLGEADVAAAQAALALAQINLGHTRMSSPIGGRVGKSSVSAGALLTANQPAALTTVQQLDPMYVDVTQSSSELLRLRKALESGQIQRSGAERAKVKLLLEDGSRYPLEGTLAFSDVTVEPGTGAVTLRAVFPNPRHELLPGMYVRALVQEGVNPQGMLVPQQGVTRNPKGEPTALVLEADGKVAQRILKVGEARGDQWLVLGGLKAGEQLIVEGLQKVKPGAEAKAVPWPAAVAAPAHPPAAKP